VLTLKYPIAACIVGPSIDGVTIRCWCSAHESAARGALRHCFLMWDSTRTRGVQTGGAAVRAARGKPPVLEGIATRARSLKEPFAPTLHQWTQERQHGRGVGRGVGAEQGDYSDCEPCNKKERSKETVECRVVPVPIEQDDKARAEANESDESPSFHRAQHTAMLDDTRLCVEFSTKRSAPPQRQLLNPWHEALKAS